MSRKCCTRQVLNKRAGSVLPLFAILLPVLCGMLGLVLDIGLLFAAHRQVQTAADAAALAAAVDLRAGKTAGSASATASQYVQYNGLPAAAVTVNLPPQQGPYAGNARYVEVVVSHSAGVWFIQVVGAASPTVSARAVAGYETVPEEGGAEVEKVFLVE